MKIKRILLVSSPLDKDDERREAVNSHCFPPLGLLRIATLLHHELPDIEIKVVDGDLAGLSSVKTLVEAFQPEIVGVSVLTPAYKSALAIAKHAKSAGVRHVIFGNDHASFFPETILRRRSDVSYIIAGDSGERDFVDLIRALQRGLDPFNTVSNLYGFAEGRLLSSSKIRVSKNQRDSWEVDWADPQFLLEGSLAKYQKAYSLRFGKYHSNTVKAFIVNNAKGCYKAHDRCFYCSIYDLKIQTGNAAGFWETIRRYWEDYGFNFFFEVCDNFGGLKAYRRSLVQTIPDWFSDSDIELMVYADANRICQDPELLDDFNKLHVRRVNIGFDSGDPGTLQTLKGFKDSEVNRKAITLLCREGIQIHCSFVLGGLGENEASMINTLSLIDDALVEPTVVAMEVSSLFPMPRAPVWDLFLGNVNQIASRPHLESLFDSLGRGRRGFEPIWKEIRSHFHDNDMIDLTLACKLWADNFTLMGYGPLQELISNLNTKIAGAGKITGGFG